MKNREIKFRAWNTIVKRYAENITFELLTKTPNTQHHILVYQQFTGFKDCNGVEIYEGDTLIDVDVTLEENVKLEDTKQQVFWCEKEGCWKLDNTFSQNKKEGWYLGKDLQDFRFKVSGNIYENALS
jgi:hypothetical protein